MSDYLRGFRCDDGLIEAALAAVGHIAMDDTALGSLVQGRGKTVELGFCRCGVSAGEDSTKLLLTGFNSGDHGGIAVVAFIALAGAFFC